MISERENQQPVGRVSPQGDTRSLAEANADVGLRCANPTYAAERENQQPVGRVSPQGVTRLLAEASADVGLSCANPTCEAIQANDWKQLAGLLKNSPNLNSDPLLIQREMRHEFP